MIYELEERRKLFRKEMLRAGENDEGFESSVLFNGNSCLHPDS